ncbi:MAG: hypothetical protein GF334_00620 [Candidatus Altiarchaeales archaeon]|nr:hypothetical protein [Candidatus Altiarchaeales archaeon]
MAVDLEGGWEEHHRRFVEKKMDLSWGQDPSVAAVYCSDSRLNFCETFSLDAQGSVFEVRNVCGLFTQDAQAALSYALCHLKPRRVVFLHHTGCGGYLSLFSGDVECEITDYLFSHGCRNLKEYVESQDIPCGEVFQVMVEEGLRRQLNLFLDFMERHFNGVPEGVEVLGLVYEVESDSVYLVPDKVGGKRMYLK